MSLGPLFWKIIATLIVASLLPGCASTNHPQDPYEDVNRAIFTFNENLDKVALKPVAKAYKKVTPSFVQTGIGNFFGNLADIWIGANNLMQGKVEDGVSDLSRVMINSSVGLLGFLDIASEAGIPKHNEDFGQTLGKWGVGSGPYLVLPLLGSSTVRDAVALPADFYADPWGYHRPIRERNIGYGIRIIHKRAGLLDAETLIKGAALNRYEFMRDAYLQRRKNLISDNGKVGDLPNYDEEEAKDAEPPKDQPIIEKDRNKQTNKTKDSSDGHLKTP